MLGQTQNKIIMVIKLWMVVAPPKNFIFCFSPLLISLDDFRFWNMIILKAGDQPKIMFAWEVAVVYTADGRGSNFSCNFPWIITEEARMGVPETWHMSISNPPILVSFCHNSRWGMRLKSFSFSFLNFVLQMPCSKFITIGHEMNRIL